MRLSIFFRLLIWKTFTLELNTTTKEEMMDVIDQGQVTISFYI